MGDAHSESRKKNRVDQTAARRAARVVNQRHHERIRDLTRYSSPRYCSATKRGEVKRTHGGILPLDFGRSVPNFQSRLASFTKEKTQIALKAVEYFKPHHVYFVDSKSQLTVDRSDPLFG